MMINSHQDTAPDREGSVPEQKKRIGRYQIERVLGTGSMGAVYLARDEMLDRPVAVKVPKFPEGSGEEVIKRFYREARSAAAISHPNICAIYDVGEDEGTHYIAMQYVEGHSLADYVGSRRQPQDEVARVVRKIAQAMHEAHGYDLVHRDLKP
ncbi:MAG: serine/threonine-protein kinase, partial [Pirellulales bacterium]|nr:serine/threonine-protein kinase [Pirellulales bacterium]